MPQREFPTEIVKRHKGDSLYRQLEIPKMVLRRFTITSLFVLMPIFGCDPASESATRPLPNGPSQESPQETVTKLETNSTSEQKPETAATGTIEGTVIYQADPKRRWRYSRYYIADSKKGSLAEAVVGLRDTKLKKLAPPAEPQESIIDQKDTRFTPETVVIRKGDRVKFTNSDPILHNVHTSNSLIRFDGSIKNGQSFSQTFKRAGGIGQPIVLGCRLHSVMQAWVFVFDHPWFQLTSTDGRFRLEKVPPGTYRLEMAHPAGDLEWSQKIEVKAGKSVMIDIRVSPDNQSD